MKRKVYFIRSDKLRLEIVSFAVKWVSDKKVCYQYGTMEITTDQSECAFTPKAAVILYKKKLERMYSKWFKEWCKFVVLEERVRTGSYV